MIDQCTIGASTVGGADPTLTVTTLLLSDPEEELPVEDCEELDDGHALIVCVTVVMGSGITEVAAHALMVWVTVVTASRSSKLNAEATKAILPKRSREAKENIVRVELACYVKQLALNKKKGNKMG